MKATPLLIIVGLIAVLVYLTYFHIPPEGNDEAYLYWGRMHIILSTIPAVIYFNGNMRKHVFPFIALVACFQVIAFGLPVFFLRINSFQMNNVLNLRAMEVSFYGLLIFYATFFFAYNEVFKKIKTFKPIPGQLTGLYYNGMVFLLLVVYGLSSVFQVDAVQQLATFCLYVYVGFSLSKLLKAKANIWENTLFLVVVSFEFVRRITSGLIAELAVFVLFLCLIIALEGSKKYLILVLFIPFSMFYNQFSAVKGAYRQVAWFGSKQLNYEEKMELIANLIETQENKQVRYEDKEGKDNFLWRFSYPLAAFSLVLTKTPSEVPYWKGDSYLPFFTKFIPRALWPTKPEENMGQRFGRAYKIIHGDDNTTSINTPILTEIYMNFALVGFYIGMCLLGLFFIFLDKMFNSTSVTYLNQIVNMSIIFPLVIMESNFSLTYGNLFLICVSLYIIFRTISK